MSSVLFSAISLYFPGCQLFKSFMFDVLHYHKNFHLTRKMGCISLYFAAIEEASEPRVIKAIILLRTWNARATNKCLLLVRIKTLSLLWSVWLGGNKAKREKWSLQLKIMNQKEKDGIFFNPFLLGLLYTHFLLTGIRFRFFSHFAPYCLRARS